MAKKVHKLTAWLALAVYLLSGLAPAQELVVCLEPDGTLALEAAEIGGCTPCGGAEELPPEEQQGIGIECCPCTDIPLPTRAEDAQAKPKSAGAPDLALPPCLVTVLFVDPAPLPPTGIDPPGAPASLDRIRTVVLRV